MARVKKSGPSTAIFGGTRVPAGNYVIANALVCDHTITSSDGNSRTFDALFVEVRYPDVDGKPGQACTNAIMLNGCHKQRVTHDHQTVPACTGTFYDDLRGRWSGAILDDVVDYINANLVNRGIRIEYSSYINLDGEDGTLTHIDFL